MTIDAITGLISGTIGSNDDANSPYLVTVEASIEGVSASVAFAWAVQLPVAPRPPVSFVVTTAADTAWVPGPINGTIVGAESTNGQVSLRSAIQCAERAYSSAPMVTITFAPDLSGATITLSLRALPRRSQPNFIVPLPWLSQNFTIVGPSGGITINGNGKQVFMVESTNVRRPASCVIENMTITNGNGTQFGGAIDCAQGQQLSLENVNLTGNGAVNGGAIANFGNLWMAFCNIYLNTATRDGAGLYNDGQAYIIGSHIWDNSTQFGGGLL